LTGPGIRILETNDEFIAKERTAYTPWKLYAVGR
jgi:hypothetical protein